MKEGGGGTGTRFILVVWHEMSVKNISSKFIGN